MCVIPIIVTALTGMWHLPNGYQYTARNVCIRFLIASCVLCNQEMKDFVAMQAGVGNLQFFPEMGQDGMGWQLWKWWKEACHPRGTAAFQTTLLSLLGKLQSHLSLLKSCSSHLPQLYELLLTSAFSVCILTAFWTGQKWSAENLVSGEAELLFSLCCLPTGLGISAHNNGWRSEEKHHVSARVGLL